MLKNAPNTKTVASFEANQLSEDLAKFLGTNSEIAAVRLIYQPQAIDGIISFLEKLNTLSHELRKIPVFVDIGNLCRGTVALGSEEKELVFEQMLNLSPLGKGGDLEINSEEWPTLFEKNALIYLEYGAAVLKVENIAGHSVRCKVIQGGRIRNSCEIHIPQTTKIPSIIDHSYIDIDRLQKAGIDFVILPGISSQKEIALIRKNLTSSLGSCPWLILRVDSLTVYQELDQLLETTDGVFISRNDLALSTDPATIPMLCKEIIQKCNDKAKPVFVASEMLSSMQIQATPTRAEVSDVANAVIDGVDGVVLSEDLAKGPYMKIAFSLSQKIITDVELQTNMARNWNRDIKAPASGVTKTIAYHAQKTAHRVGAKAIVCLTKEGITALRLASFRPNIPIIAVTFSKEISQRLSVVRGVFPIQLDVNPELDEVLPVLNEKLLANQYLSRGDFIVLVTITLSPVGREASNLFSIQTIE